VGLATLGLVVAGAAATRLSDGHSQGRDATRLLGRGGATAEWTPADLDWGPVYEPHRFPDGASVGERLRLPPATYRIDVVSDGSLPLEAPPELILRGEGPAAQTRHIGMRRRRDGFEARFEVFPSDTRGLRLALSGGSPFAVREIRLALQPGEGSAVQ
jgi:hypothetical protein